MQKPPPRTSGVVATAAGTPARGKNIMISEAFPIDLICDRVKAIHAEIAHLAETVESVSMSVARIERTIQDNTEDLKHY